MKVEQLGNIKLYNADCMEVMKTFKDKQFSLAIIDPPYGLGDNKLTQGGTWAKKYASGDADWDNKPPTKEYFDELFRVSRNQIIWGGNYFDLPPTRCFLIWDKIAQIRTMADCEFAWTSFDSNAKVFRHVRNENRKRIHITQKPVALYKWLLQNYAKQGDKILDTHFGSLSIGIACHDMGFELTACELDKDYYEQAKQRLINHQKQLILF